MSVQMCEGVWRTRCGQRVVVTRCESDDGRQWTDGADYYSYDGSIWGDERARSRHDLVAFVGLLPDRPQQDQTAEIDRLRIELQETYAGWSDSNSALAEQTVEIERLRAELQTEFAAAQQLRAENDSLTVRLQRSEAVAAEALQRWETTEQVCLRIITALAGVRS